MNKIPGIKRHDEDILQEFFAMWLDHKGLLFTASAAGMRTSMSVGIRMKRMGAKKGFPDIQILEPTEHYSGLFIELKAKDGRPSHDQKIWSRDLNAKGYLAVIMPPLDFNEGLEWCKKIVEDYLANKL